MQKTIEIEFRSILTKKKYNELKKILDKHAKDLGPDDKDVYFFIMPDKLLKVVNNISKKNAQVVLKLNKIGKGSDFEEVEMPINIADIKKWVRTFKSLGYTNIMHSFQKRQNYKYKGVEIALKYSKTWGYHTELEKVISDKSKKKQVEEKIKKIVQELGLNLMTNNELKKFTAKQEKKYKAKK